MCILLVGYAYLLVDVHLTLTVIVSQFSRFYGRSVSTINGLRFAISCFRLLIQILGLALLVCTVPLDVFFF